MIGALSAALLLASVPHQVAIGSGNTYSPQALRVAPGDTVTWAASNFHPLVLENEGVAYTTAQQRTLSDSVKFYCANHGGPGGAGMSGVVAVGDDNAPPSIAIMRDTAAPASGQPVAFHVVATDPERLPLRIDWDMDGDGTFELVGAGTSASGTYDAGDRRVGARAVDDLGATAEASHAFTIPGAASGPPPAAPPPAPPGASQQADALAPAVAVRAPRSLTPRRLRRRGVKVTLTPSEDGRLVAELRSRRGRRLARATAEARAGEPTTLRLRPRRVKPGRLTLRVVAIDLAGNRTTIKRALKVRRAR